MSDIFGPIVSRATPASTPIKPDLQRRLDEAAKAAAPRSVMGSVTYSANDTVTQAMLKRDREAVVKRSLAAGIEEHERIEKEFKPNTTIKSILKGLPIPRIEEMRAVLLKIVNHKSGGKAIVMAMLNQYDAKNISGVPAHNYPALYQLANDTLDSLEAVASPPVEPAEALESETLYRLQKEYFKLARQAGIDSTTINYVLVKAYNCFGSTDASVSSVPSTSYKGLSDWFTGVLAALREGSYAKGGIASKPKVTLFGAKDVPEACVPLAESKTFNVTIVNTGKEASGLRKNHFADREAFDQMRGLRRRP